MARASASRKADNGETLAEQNNRRRVSAYPGGPTGTSHASSLRVSQGRYTKPRGALLWTTGISFHAQKWMTDKTGYG